MPSKYRESVFALLELDRIQSTSEIQTRLEKVEKRKINWLTVNGCLTELERDDRVIKYSSKGGHYWVRKKIQ